MSGDQQNHMEIFQKCNFYPGTYFQMAQPLGRAISTNGLFVYLSVCLFVYNQLRALWLVDAVEWGYIALSGIGQCWSEFSEPVLQ